METKTATFEILKDKVSLEVTENQDIKVWKEFLEDFLDKMDKYTVEIDERITDFLDFWAIASCWLKEKLGLTDEDDNEEESIEDRGEEQTMRGGNKQDWILGKGEKPTGEKDVGADYRDDREKDLDQEATKDEPDEEAPTINKEMDHCEVRDAGDLLDEEEVKEFVEEDVAEGELGNDGGTTQYLEEVVAFVMKTENELEERKGVRDKYEDEANNDCEEMLRIIRMSREAEDEGVAL